MRKCLIGAALLLAAVTATAPAWWVKGHGTIAEAAVARLPEEMPAFFRAGGKALSHCAGDPDRWKNRDAAFLRAAAAPDHFIDMEDLEGNDFPADRYLAASLIVRLKHRPDRTGMLPYALMENFERLMCAFYDLRAEKDNPAIQAKCLVYAGILSHFTGDAAMPLHTTRDYDGKKGADGKIIQKGIHAKIDAFPEKNGFTPEEVCRGLTPKKIDDAWGHVAKTLKESYTHIPRCYELDAAGGFDQPTPESRAFIMDRCRVAAQFTMDMWYTAWLKSADLPPHY